MKKLGITVAMLLSIGLSSISFAQQVQQTTPTQQSSVPQAIKYQAVARTANGEIIANQNVSFRISIMQGSAEGTAVYQETQTATTNQFGLANISIGMGAPVTGQFNTIEWGKASYFAKIEFDPKGGSEYAYMGTSELLSVPYSLYSEHAKTADNIPTFPVKAALQATNLQAPFDSPETGMLVYNSSTSGTAPYNVVPGYYYNAGTPEAAQWVPLSSAADQNATKRALSLGTNTSYGGVVQDAGTGSAVGNCNSGSNNSAFGDSAMNSSMTGNNNTGEGYFILRKLSSGADNTAVGYEALNNTTSGYENTAVGSGALSSNPSNIQNTAVGYQCLYNNQQNGENGFGYQAMYSNTTGTYNTGIGELSLYSNKTGSYNTALGFYALHGDTMSYNTAVGYAALYTNTKGQYNTASGYGALEFSTIGNGGTSDGYNALRSNTTGSYNTAVGDSALYNVTTGDSNTAIGYHATVTTATFNNSIAVGYGVSVNASDKAVIGNPRMGVIGGQVGWSTLSDGRYKANVQDYSLGLNFIKSLRPVSYIYNNNTSGVVYDGFIAQEVEQTLQKLGMHFSGLCTPQNEQDNYSLRYGDFVVPLVNAVKELDTKNENLQAENNELKDKETKLENELSDLQKTVNSLVQAQANSKH